MKKHNQNGNTTPFIDLKKLKKDKEKKMKLLNDRKEICK